MQPDVEGLVDDLCELAERRFGDLRFTDPLGRIEITARIRHAVAVRIELPSTQYLHLSSVIIDADGLDDPVRQTTRAMSSVWKDYDQTLDSGVIFDAAHTRKAFHTKKDDHPWLEISFDRPRDLHKIAIRNVDGPNSSRARGLQVLVRTADGQLRTVYDGVARERQFIGTGERYANVGTISAIRVPVAGRVLSTARRLSRRQQPAVAPAPDLARMFCNVWLGDHQAVRFALDRSDIEPDIGRRFQAAVNQRILYSRELEWTSHGIRRSFRFWTPQQQHRYLDFTLDVTKALRDLNDQVCLGFGSVLSVVRDQALLPHDDDLDVLIGFEPEQAATHADGRRLVRECLTAHGFSVTGGMHAYQWVSRPEGGPRLDVFIGVFEGDRISWYPGRRGALTRDMMFPPQTREFLGRDVPLPNQPETYLEQIYGPGWVSPDPGFRHNWTPAEYADIAG